jgi:hypothetical protein
MTKQRTITAAQYLRQQVNEHQLQVLVLAHLEATARPELYWFAIPNAARRSMVLASRMKAEGLRAGVADLCIMAPAGRVHWLELKAGRGAQSDAQKGFEAICKRLGHDYAVVRNLDEAITVLKQWGVLK